MSHKVLSRKVYYVLGVAGAIGLAAACSASPPTNTFTTSSSGAGGAGTGGMQSGSTGNPSGTGTGGEPVLIGSSTGAGTSSGQQCNTDPNVDDDGDGFTEMQGDCNDCDANVNPGAIEVIAMGDGGMVPADEDCDGMVDNVPPASCDGNLALTDTDAYHGAQAIELCQTATASDKKWGVLDAKYVHSNGAAFASPGTQVGIQSNFGPNVNVQGGQRMLMLSSGNARLPGQQNSCDSLSCQHGPATPPAGFPQDNPDCPPSLEINDDVGLELTIRAPTNATGYSFNFKFYSFEYPEWVCNDYNDQFIALVNPPPMGSINGNISFDSNGSAVSVNLGFFDVCDPAGIGNFASFCFSGTCPAPPNPYCPSGTSELAGTGFDIWNDAGGTVWLKSQAPITGGSIFTIRFAIWDTGDDLYDSSVIVDNFQWIASGGTVVVGTDPIDTPK